MKSRSLVLFAIFIVVGVTVYRSVAVGEELIPREVLFGNPTKALPEISPDGTKLAYLAPVNNVLNVWVKTIGKDDDRVVTRDTSRGIRRYRWAHDGNHLLYLQDTGGDENWRLYGVDLASGAIKDYTPFNNVQVRIMRHDKNHPHYVVLAINRRDPKAHDVYFLDLRTGKLELKEQATPKTLGMLLDARAEIRAKWEMNDEGGANLFLKRDGRWALFRTWGFEDWQTSGPVTFSKDGAHLYIEDSTGVNASRLLKVDLESNTEEVLFADGQYDVQECMIDPDTYEVLAIGVQRARYEWHVLDDAIQKDFDFLATVNSGDMHVTDWDHSKNKWIVTFLNDDKPVAYYLYDRMSRSAQFLFYNKSALNKYSLAKMQSVSFKARDGLQIHGYLTQPRKPAHNKPMVLCVHGGPWVRDTWGYDSEAQWFANRGYACLQVNYRGSSGYGKAFMNAGNREWGGKMHDDLIDGVNWAIEQGYARRNNVAIFGGSYGGYAALVGATFTPDVFRCAVDIVGISNLLTMIASYPPYWKKFLANVYRRVGNPDTEPDFLKSRSPLFKVDNIKIPILIAQGANDPRVKQEESEQIVAAMKKKGLNYEYMLFPDEGHGFAKPQNRITFYAAAERFLARHLGGRCETA